MVIGDQLATVGVNQIVPAVLIVGSVAGKAVDLSVGTLGDGLGSFIHILVGPVVGGIVHAVLVKDGLVVDHGDGIMILGQGIDTAVVAGVQVHNAFVVVGGIGGCIGSDVVIQLQQNVIFHVHLDGVGVHPKHIGHLAAGSAGFQQSPVVVPVHHFDGDLDTGLLSPLVCDLLQTSSLVVIPDVDLDFFHATLFCCRSGAGFTAAAGNQRQAHDECHCHCKQLLHSFHWGTS